MNNDQQSNQGTNDSEELKLLRARAKLIGLTHSNNISVETLKEKIAEHLEQQDQANQAQQIAEAEGQSGGTVDGDRGVGTEPDSSSLVQASSAVKRAKKSSLRQMQYDKYMKLVRVRITCMDPKKKDLPGEIIVVANEVLGTVKKFIPFGEATENGYHIPYCIYKMLERRKFLNVKVVKNRATGTNQVSTTWAREFAIEVLPPLNQKELATLAAAQMAAGSVEDVLS